MIVLRSRGEPAPRLTITVDEARRRVGRLAHGSPERTQLLLHIAERAYEGAFARDMRCDFRPNLVDACARPCVATLRAHAGFVTANDAPAPPNAVHAPCTLVRLALEEVTTGDLADAERASAAAFLAWLWIEAEVPERAEALLARLSEQGAHRDIASALWVEAGRRWASRGRTDDAAQCFGRALAAAPSPDARADAWVAAGFQRLEDGESRLAFAAFTRALAEVGDARSSARWRHALWGLAQARALELAAEGRWSFSATFAWLAEQFGGTDADAAELMAPMLQRFVVVGRPAWALEGYTALIERASLQPDCDWHVRRVELVAAVWDRARALTALRRVVASSASSRCLPAVLERGWTVVSRLHRAALDEGSLGAATAGDFLRLYELIEASLSGVTAAAPPRLPPPAARAWTRAEALDAAGGDCESGWLDIARSATSGHTRLVASCRAALCRARAVRAVASSAPIGTPPRPSQVIWHLRGEATQCGMGEFAALRAAPCRVPW